MNDLIPATRLEGQILMDGNGIYDKKVDVDALRRTRIPDFINASPNFS